MTVQIPAKVGTPSWKATDPVGITPGVMGGVSRNLDWSDRIDNPKWATYYRTLDLPPGDKDPGHRASEVRIDIDLPALAASTLIGKGEMLYKIDLTVNFKDKYGIGIVEVFEKYLEQGLVRTTPKAHMSAERTDAKHSEQSYYDLTYIIWSGVLWSKSAVSITFPSGTSHTPPGDGSWVRALVKILAVGVMQVKTRWELGTDEPILPDWLFDERGPEKACHRGSDCLDDFVLVTAL